MGDSWSGVSELGSGIESDLGFLTVPEVDSVVVGRMHWVHSKDLLEDGIDRLVADSKFFPDETLLGFLKAIAAQISRVASAGTSDNVTPETTIAAEKGKPTAGAGVTADLDVAAYHQERLPAPSAATVAWLATHNPLPTRIQGSWLGGTF